MKYKTSKQKIENLEIIAIRTAELISLLIFLCGYIVHQIRVF